MTMFLKPIHDALLAEADHNGKQAGSDALAGQRDSRTVDQHTGLETFFLSEGAKGCFCRRFGELS